MQVIKYCKTFVPVILLMMIALSGCTRPITRSTADKYLRESLLVDFTYLYSENTNNSKKEIYHYYRCENGIEFYVKTGVYDGNAGKETRSICNYNAMLLEHENIYDKIDNFQYNGYQFYRGTGSSGLASIVLSDYTDIESAANFLFAFVDTLEFIPINIDVYQRHFRNMYRYSTISFMIYYGEDIRCLKVVRIPMGIESHGRVMDSYSAEKLIDKPSLIRMLENTMAEDSKLLCLELGVPMSVMSREPSPRIDKLMLDGEELEPETNSFQFSWDNEKQDYFSFINMIHWSSEFRYLVECLGGTFTLEASGSKWVIGEDTWEVEIVSAESNGDSYDAMNVSKNGHELLQNRNVYGIITISDLELLLSVEIVWENHESVAYIVK